MAQTIVANLAASQKLVKKAAAADRSRSGTLKAKPSTKGTTK